jgi:sugar phosphate isomerase/epimerase
MKLGIFAKIFAGSDPAIVLTQARRAGFDTVQYNMACSGLESLPCQITDEAASRVARASQESGVEIAAISATYNMIDPDRSRRAAGRDGFKAIAAKAHQMGTGLLTHCSGSMNPDNQWAWHKDNDSTEAWSEMLSEFERLLPIAECYSLVLGVEPELANVVSSAAKAKQLIDDLRSSHIGMVLDPANLFEADHVPERAQIICDAINLLGDHIVLNHAKDRAENGSLVAVGEGCISFDAFIRQLVEVGFDGPLLTHGCTNVEAPRVAEFLNPKLSRFEQSHSKWLSFE